MNIKITATHEDGSQMVQVRKPENVEFTIRLMKECGYVSIRTEATNENSKSGM